MEISIAFAQALKQCRKHKGLTQEDFGDVSGRTYISEIERGIKAPTLRKIEALAGELELEPTTLVAQCFLNMFPEMSIEKLLSTVETELKAISKN